MDMNPFSTQPTAPQAQTPDYLKPASNPTMAGSASNLIKALMDGNNKFNASHPGGMPAPAGDGDWKGTSSVGGAPLAGYSGVTPNMPPALPPTPAAGMQGGAPMMPPMAAPQPPMVGNNPFMTGAPPATVDPVTQALMSPIPGM